MATPRKTESNQLPVETNNSCWNFTHPALTQWQTGWPVDRWASVGVVVAVSGGGDSVALLHAIHQLHAQNQLRWQTSARQNTAANQTKPPRGFLVVAHFNHNLRGDQSDGDQHFVADLADRFNLKFCRARGAGQSSDESSLATERMRFLVRTAHHNGCRYIATAHHRDDNVETLLHQLFRGSGAAGLTAMSMFRNLPQDLVLARPWINTPRETISDYLKISSQKDTQPSHRHDESNNDLGYTRNWIRHEVLPLIRTRFPNCDDAISGAGDSVRQWRTAIDHWAANWLESALVAPPDSEFAVRIAMDQQTPAAIIIAGLQQLWSAQQWPLRDMTRSHWGTLCDMIASRQNGTHPLPSDIIAVSADGHVDLRQLSPVRRGI